jgi:hypothetical protein
VYTQDLIALEGTAGFTGFGDSPSINNNADIAFVGQLGGGTEGVFFRDAANKTVRNITPTFSDSQHPYVFGRSVQINDSDQVVAVDRSARAGGGTEWLLRVWDAQGTDDFTIRAEASAPRVPGAKYDAFTSFVGIANAPGGGEPTVVFPGFDAADPLSWSLNLQTGATAKPEDLADVKSPASLRPALSDDNQVVARVGDTNTAADPLLLFTRYPGGLYGSTLVAGAANGFTSVGRAAGISDRGRTVYFSGDIGAAAAKKLNITPGPGIFARIQTGTTTLYIRLGAIRSIFSTCNALCQGGF